MSDKLNLKYDKMTFKIPEATLKLQADLFLAKVRANAKVSRKLATTPNVKGVE